MRGAKIIRKFKKGAEKCTLWKKDKLEKTICWDTKTTIVKRFTRRGRKCQLVTSPGKQWIRCVKVWRFGPKGRFLFKGANITRRFIRQGQQCATYQRGPAQYTQCRWTGAYKGAKVIKRFNRGGERCSLWQLKKETKTVCWNNKVTVVKRFSKAGGVSCTLYQKANRQW